MNVDDLRVIADDIADEFGGRVEKNGEKSFHIDCGDYGYFVWLDRDGNSVHKIKHS